jgi:hypothetical protein
VRRICLVGYTVLLCACGGGDSPSGLTATPTPVGGLRTGSQLSTQGQGSTLAIADLPNWVLNPPTMPEGRQGKDNCTFAFGQEAQADFHPDGGCWETSAPDGLTRQQLHNVHFPTASFCGGAPGDSSAIRVCASPGIQTICGLTGPNGCVGCVPNTSCH